MPIHDYLIHPTISPIAFEIGPLAVRWYGLMYLLAFVAFMLLGRVHAKRLDAAGAPSLDAKQIDDLAELKLLFDGVQPAELDRLKGRIKRSLIIQQESSPSRAGSIALDWYYLSRVRTMSELSQIIDDLTPATINAYLAANRPREFTVVTVGPEALRFQP